MFKGEIYRMEEYLKQYQNINKQFGKIIGESLQGANLRIHAKAASFIEDYEAWIKLNDGAYETCVYKEALSQYKAMLLFWNMGLYKYSFMALRGYFELTLFGIQLSASELNYRLWKQSEMDLYWSQLVDPDNGIFSAKFVKAFQPSFIENAKSMLVIAKNVYRECSEFIHSNYSTVDFLPEATRFSQDVFDCIASKVETINQVISFMFTVRYLEKLICENKLEEYENCIMDNIGFIPCISEVYK
jgi:hypothetical protein